MHELPIQFDPSHFAVLRKEDVVEKGAIHRDEGVEFT